MLNGKPKKKKKKQKKSLKRRRKQFNQNRQPDADR